MTCTSNDKGEGDNSDEGEEFVCAAAMTNPPISYSSNFQLLQ
jgi:hypothetical protein